MSTISIPRYPAIPRSVRGCSEEDLEAQAQVILDTPRLNAVARTLHGDVVGILSRDPLENRFCARAYVYAIDEVNRAAVLASYVEQLTAARDSVRYSSLRAILSEEEQDCLQADITADMDRDAKSLLLAALWKAKNGAEAAEADLPFITPRPAKPRKRPAKNENVRNRAEADRKRSAAQKGGKKAAV